MVLKLVVLIIFGLLDLMLVIKLQQLEYKRNTTRYTIILIWLLQTKII